MLHCVMLSSPHSRRLTLEDVQSLERVWHGRDRRWLAQDEAVEFTMSQAPSDFEKRWAEYQAKEIDVIIVPQKARRKAVLLADMDSTMIEQECIDELADEAGVGDYVKKITAQAMNGELDFEEALIARVALLEGLAESIVQDVLAKRITMRAGGAILLATMRANNAYSALVSGGFTAFTAAVSERLGFDEHRANRLLSHDARLTGKVAFPILGRDAKIEALKDITQAQGVSHNDVIAVGDGANDLGMLDLAGLGIAMHAKPSVAKACRHRVNFGDLTALLYIQGYGRDEFVTA